GNALADTEKEVKYGASYLLGVAEKSHYDFDGWMLEDGTMLTNSAGASLANWSFTENKTVKAKWVERAIQENGLTYKLLEDGTWAVSAIQGYDYPDKFEIPSQYEGVAITVLQSMQWLLTSEVVIPSNVTEISASAFANNAYIEVLDMSAFSGVIGNGAFQNSNLKIVNFGSTKAIGSNAFANTYVPIFVIPASVESIGDGAFNSQYLIEIDFAGAFPELGSNVFGNGTGNSEINIIASSDAWEALIKDTTSDVFESAVSEVLGISTKANSFYIQATAEEIADSLAIVGEYSLKNEQKIVYRGFGLYAALFDIEDSTVETAIIYDDTHFYLANEADLRDTFIFDTKAKQVSKLDMNADGETILDGVLYDYQGTAFAYIVPSDVTEIASGAVQNNDYIAFLVLGDSVTAIGDEAFVNGGLMSVRFGENLQYIGEGAFLNQYYLLEAIFTGDEAPEIGTAAFCNIYELRNGNYFVPTFMFNEFTEDGEYAFIYTKYSYSSEEDMAPWVDAFNATLVGIDLVPVESEIAYQAGAYGLFNTLKTTLGYTSGYEYELPFGTLIMSGTSQYSGYAIVVFDEDSEYEGTSFAYFQDANGYGGTVDADKSLKKITVTYGATEEDDLLTFVIYGRFNSEGKFVARGEEGGAHGSLDGDLLYLDGFGKYSLFAADGSIEDGTYEKDGATINLSSGLTATFDSVTNKVTFDGNELEKSVGEEAGVYYDLKNDVKLELDGKPYKTNDGTFHGTLRFTYGGQVYEYGYFFGSSSVTLYFDYVDGENFQYITYTRVSEEYIFAGRITLGDNDEVYVQFNVETRGVAGTFTNANGDTIELDGFAGATLIIGDDEAVKGTYTFFGDTANILVLVDEVAYIAILDTDTMTFAYPDAPEAGAWYVANVTAKGLYLDGEGHSIYRYSSYFYQGTYEYNSETNEILTTVRPEYPNTDIVGTLNIEEGYGFTVCDTSGYSSSKVLSLISKTPFVKFGSNLYLNYSFYGIYLNEDNTIGNKQIQLYLYRMENLVVARVDSAFAVVGSVELVDGTTFQATFDWAFGTKTQITLDIEIAVSASGSYSMTAQLANHYAEITTAKSGSNTVKIYVLDEDRQYVAIGSPYSYSALLSGGNGPATWEDAYSEAADGEFVLVEGSYVAYNESEHEGMTRYNKSLTLKVGSKTVTNYGEENATVK
ncbi:MAG: leucine-rich repeat domain-containing protein, partial [Clostridia bacterium]|nr:leucine-rich repeat domain-containing protein [Clostridia bacterium]